MSKKVDLRSRRVQSSSIKRRLTKVQREAFQIVSDALIRWGYGGVLRSVMFVGPDGTINIQAIQSGTGSRIILYPHKKGPDVGANAELTIYGMTDEEDGPEENFERVSLTQMNDRERNVRLTMERGGAGKFREMWFGYDTFEPGKAYFPLRITPNGVFTADIDGNLTKIGG